MSAKRVTAPEIRTKALTFAPSGRHFAIAATEGMLVYSLDETLVFDPFDLGEVRKGRPRRPARARD